MSFSSILGTILLLTIVGAIIGGMTNSIAIKMLFKPYHKKMIGKWRVPFTPGLIPKRHDEIAQELGRLVMKHLITADRLKIKLLEPMFKEQLIEFAQKKLSLWFEDEATVRERLSEWVDPNQVIEVFEKQFTHWVNRSFDDYFQSRKHQTIGEVLPEVVVRTVEANFQDFAEYFTQSLVNYLESDEGKETVTTQLNQLFEGKGFFGNMLGLFLGNQSIVDKLYPELISFMGRPTFTTMIEKLLTTEWNKWLSRPFNDLSQKFQLESDGKEWLTHQLLKQLPIRSGMDLKPRDLLYHWKDSLLTKAVPWGINLFLQKASEKIPEVLRTLDLEALVTEQVRQFSIQELEEVILIVSKKEFKMITYLGALLGGLIGIVQAFIVIWMG